MKRSLVVIDDTDIHRELLAEAGKVASGNGADLVLFSWMTVEEFSDSSDTLEIIENAEHTTYSGATALDTARKFAMEFGDEVLGEDGLDYEVTAVVTDEDERADEILDAAEEFDCDHIFIVGRRRSPTGKVLFGDVAQRVILNFDGFVTIAMD